MVVKGAHLSEPLAYNASPLDALTQVLLEPRDKCHYL